MVPQGYIHLQSDEKIGIVGKEVPASTMKILPEMYSDESCTRYRTSVVSAGSEVPNVCKGTVLRITFLSQS